DGRWQGREVARADAPMIVDASHCSTSSCVSGVPGLTVGRRTRLPTFIWHGEGGYRTGVVRKILDEQVVRGHGVVDDEIELVHQAGGTPCSNPQIGPAARLRGRTGRRRRAAALRRIKRPPRSSREKR